MTEKKDKLTEMANEIMGLGSAFFEKKGPDKIMPTWFAQTHEDDNYTVFATPWGNDIEKMAYTAAIKEHYAKIKAVRYALLSETWVITREKEDNYDGEAPSEAPDRKETLTVMAEDHVSRILMRREIIRPSKGKPFLKAIETFTMNKKDLRAEEHGHMLNMLPKVEEGMGLQ